VVAPRVHARDPPVNTATPPAHDNVYVPLLHPGNESVTGDPPLMTSVRLSDGITQDPHGVPLLHPGNTRFIGDPPLIERLRSTLGI
jgi:hypothetical protein